MAQPICHGNRSKTFIFSEQTYQINVGEGQPGQPALLASLFEKIAIRKLVSVLFTLFGTSSQEESTK